MRKSRPPLALFARCLALTGFALVAAALIVAAPPASDLMAAYADKLRRLEATKPPRLIFVGGSGLAYGLNSQEVERAFSRPVVNTGFHAGLGLRFMLTHVAPFLFPGDIVIVVPEYGALRDQDSEDLGLWSGALLSDVPESLHGARLADLPEVIAGFPPFAQQKLLIDPLQKLGRARGASYDYAWSRATFDARGDEVGHLSAPQPLHRFDNWPPLDPKVDEHVEMLRKSVDGLEKMGVRVAVAFQALDVDVFNQNRDTIASIAAVLRKSLGDRVLGTPEDWVLPDDAVFNTPNHANAIGREINTMRLVTDIAKWTGRSSR
jgi:hypothetical protein